jgi:hypothetical protein
MFVSRIGTFCLLLSLAAGQKGHAAAFVRGMTARTYFYMSKQYGLKLRYRCY